MAGEPARRVNVRRRVPNDEAPPTEAPGMRSEGPADEVEAARAEIEQTRAEVAETIDAIQERLDPEKIKAQGRTRATSAVRYTGARTAESARQNPQSRWR